MSLTSPVLGVLWETQQPLRCWFFAMTDLWLNNQTKFLFLECKLILCARAHRRCWKVVTVLGLCMQEGEVAAGWGGCFDPDLTYLIVLLFLVLCRSFTFLCTRSLCRFSPLCLGFPFYSRPAEIAAVWSFYTRLTMILVEKGEVEASCWRTQTDVLIGMQAGCSRAGLEMTDSERAFARNTAEAFGKRAV